MNHSADFHACRPRFIRPPFMQRDGCLPPKRPRIPLMHRPRPSSQINPRLRSPMFSTPALVPIRPPAVLPHLNESPQASSSSAQTTDSATTSSVDVNCAPSIDDSLINMQTSHTLNGPDVHVHVDPVNFSSEAAGAVLQYQKIVFMGCSVQRDLYKDVVLLLQEERYLSQYENRVKGSKSVVGDQLMEGGILDVLKNDPTYREVREYKTDRFHIQFYFITRAYNSILSRFLDDMALNPPEVIILNSAVWDVNRNGYPFNKQAYYNNLRLLCQHLIRAFPKAHIIWLHQPPMTSQSSQGRIVLPEHREILRLNVETWIREAAEMADEQVKMFGIDTIDLFHLMVPRTPKYIARDGVHWASPGYRLMTNLLLFKLCKFWNKAIPTSSVTYRQPVEMNATELKSRMDEMDNDWLSLKQTTVDSLIDFSSCVPILTKPLPQSVDREKLNKLADNLNDSDVVSIDADLDRNFNTKSEGASEIVAHSEIDEPYSGYKVADKKKSESFLEEIVETPTRIMRPNELDALWDDCIFGWNY